jgi:ectoine hydroxylase-related dioxygenase (phytanoyl-CoA dioxygenase family)
MRRAPHPWNAGFTWTDHAGPFSAISAEQARDFDDVGYFVMEDAIDEKTRARLIDELEPGDEAARRFLARSPDGRLSVAGLDTQTVAPHAVTRSAFVREFVASELLAGIARDLVGPNVRLYWDQSVFKQPHGAEPVLWHQDNGYTYVEPQAYLTCWIPLTDATPENGCVAVMPGVHRDGTLAHRTTSIGQECWGDWSTAVEVPARAGSIVVFSSLTPHATKRNSTDAVRRAYIVQYAPDGAAAHYGDPDSGPPTRTEALGDDERRYRIVRDGARVEPVSAR